MAQAAQNPNLSPETREPSPKILKTDETGVAGTKHTGISPFSGGERLSEKAILPSRASPSAGYDLSSALETKVPARGKGASSDRHPNCCSRRNLCSYRFQYAAPRSGLAWKHSIDVGAGVVDADYRGPVGLILFNHCDVDFEMKPGDRIAQLILEKIVTLERLRLVILIQL